MHLQALLSTTAVTTQQIESPMSVPMGYLGVPGCGIDPFGYEWDQRRYIRGALGNLANVFKIKIDCFVLNTTLTFSKFQLAQFPNVAKDCLERSL